MFRQSLLALASVTCGFSVIAAPAQAIPNVELEGITYEISFESDFFNPDFTSELQTLIESQPWFTGIQTQPDLALDAASQVYSCGGVQFSLCSTPFDTFGSTDPVFGGISPQFIYDTLTFSDSLRTQVNAAAVGFSSSSGNNELRTIGSNSNFEIFYAVATPVTESEPVPEPLTIFGSLTTLVMGLTLKKKSAV